jgi:hypothetical protein
MENVKKKTGKITEGLKKGTVATGVIIRITDGLASDFMTVEQVEKRQTNTNDPYTEIEIGIPDKSIILKPMSFKDYTRINDGGIPLASRMGQIMNICELAEDAEIPLVAREINVMRNGTPEKFVAWEIAV